MLLGMGCKPEEFSDSTDLQLSFSADTIAFDTVFTTVGTATHVLKIYNRNISNVRIAQILLAGGASSPFEINLDGLNGHQFADIALRANDSLYVFVRMIPPHVEQDTPLCLADSLLFVTNGNRQQIQLQAWGQNVVRHNNTYFDTDTTLTAQLPHLIYGRMTVAAGATLRIEAGARLHFHPGASLNVHGSLIASGTAEQPIVLEGDRLEKYYRDKPGQWNGVALSNTSQRCNLSWTQIRNCITALQINGLSDTLRLDHCQLTSCSHMALSGQRINVKANNCLIANAANACIALHGGTHRFIHCTVACYWGGFNFRNGVAVQLSAHDTLPPLCVMLENSIVYGSATNELEIAPNATYTLSHCVLRTTMDTTDSRLSHIVLDAPKFISTAKLNFNLDTLSPAIGRANSAVANLYPIDLNGNNRLDDGQPDIGAYERQEK